MLDRCQAIQFTIKLDKLLFDRKMTSTELAKRIGTTKVNVSRIKNGAIKGVRFSTLYELCKALECQPGDILGCVIDEDDASEQSES